MVRAAEVVERVSFAASISDFAGNVQRLFMIFDSAARFAYDCIRTAKVAEDVTFAAPVADFMGNYQALSIIFDQPRRRKQPRQIVQAVAASPTPTIP